jgi:choline-sulfatase
VRNPPQLFPRSGGNSPDSSHRQGRRGPPRGSSRPAARPPRALTRKTLSALGLVLTGTLLGASCGDTGSERTQNLLLVSLDTTRADRLGCYGRRPSPTPHVDRLAETAIVFESALSPAPLTLPAHASLLTGLTPVAHGIHLNQDRYLGDAATTLAELLSDNGFRTIGVVSAAVLASEYNLDQGFEVFEDDLPDTQRGCEESARLAVSWLRRVADDPFFLFLHLFDPHEPLDPPPAFSARFPADPYAAEISYADSCVGKVLEELGALGKLESTTILITADHGEMLGEHGEPTHGFFVHQSAIRVPLILRIAGSDSPKRVSEAVGLVDVVPTVCSLFGLPCPPGLPGKDLSRWASAGEETGGERLLLSESVVPPLYGANPLLALSSDRWRFIDGIKPQLFDLRADPEERRNLATAEPRRTARYRNQLVTRLAADARRGNEAVPRLEREAREKLSALGYVTGAFETGLAIHDDRDDAPAVLPVHLQLIRATALIEGGSLDEAERILRGVARDRPEISAPYFQLARLERRRGRAAAARASLESALERDPGDAVILYELADLLATTGDHAGALARFAEVLRALPRHDLVHSRMGDELLALERRDRAEVSYRNALRVNPRQIEARYALISLYAGQGRLALAREQLEEALELAVESPLHMNLAAWVLATLELGIPAAPAYLDTLAAALAASGDFEAAVQVAERALAGSREIGDEQLEAVLLAHLERFRRGERL